jgi:sterol desaturase/sphingolipid hydroxylase (fatty acid hydroxylase superfamily)
LKGSEIETSFIIDALLRPLDAFVISQSSVYWPYLLSALALAVGITVISAYGAKTKVADGLSAQLSRKIWWGRSTRVDYLYFVVNAIFFGSIIAPLMLAGADVGVWIQEALLTIVGTAPQIEWDTATTRVLYTVLFFVAYDFGRFLAHWVQHQFDSLWQFHKVHHSAEALTPITSFRVHPVDLFIMGLGGNFFGGVVTGVFFYLTDGEITVVTFLGTHLLIAVYNLIGNLRHSHIWLDYGVIGYVFISPAQHQVHHSTLPQHIGKNCGFAIAIWDYIFGTLYVPREKETFPMGLGDGTDGTWHSVQSLYLRPFVCLWDLWVRKNGT